MKPSINIHNPELTRQKKKKKKKKEGERELPNYPEIYHIESNYTIKKKPNHLSSKRSVFTTQALPQAQAATAGQAHPTFCVIDVYNI